MALSISLVKALLKLVGFAPAAAMLEGGQDLYQLLTDISNGSLGDPNAEMIRSLNSVMYVEIDQIEADLKNHGVDRTQVKQTLTTLLNATRSTIKNLSADESKLLEAIRNSDSFADLVKHEAVALPKDSDENTQNFYERLLEVVAAEFLTLTPGSPNFNRVALTSLLHCFPALTNQIERLEQNMHDRFDGVDGALRKVDESAAAYHKDLKDELDSIHEDLHNITPNSHPTELKGKVWGSRPATLNHWIERDPTSNGTSLQDTIFNTPFSQRGSHCVVVGRAGSGKTTLAASIASRCESDMWSLVAWIDASTHSNIENGLIAMGESVLGIQASNQQERRLRVEQVLAGLRDISKVRCLFVYDNVESLDYLEDVLPDGPGVHILVTTRRNSGWSNQKDWTIYTLGNFTHDESVTHLLTVTKDTDCTTANKLASYLDNLPLAVAQAAATCSRYYSNLQDYFSDLQAADIEELLEPIEGSHYSKGAISALQIAANSVLSSITDHKVQIEAEKILAALCYLAESGIPTQWLKPNIHLPSRKAYQELLDSSIIEQLNDGRTTSIHRLQAHAIRTRWGIDDYHIVADKVCATISRQQELISDEIGSKYSQTLTRNIIAQIYAMSHQKHSRFLFRCIPFLDCFYQTLTHVANVQVSQPSLQSGEDIILANAILLIANLSTSNSYKTTEDINEELLRKEIVYKILQHFEGSIIRELSLSGYLDPQALSAHFVLARAYQLSGFLEVAIDHYELLLRDACAHNFSPYDTFNMDVRNSLEDARRELAQQQCDSSTKEREEED